MKISKNFLLLAAVLSSALLSLAQSKPKLTLDEFFNSVSYDSIAISPDGASVVLVTNRADWDQKIFRTDLWLYRAAASPSDSTLIELTQSGHDSDPKWSPDGRWIAFLSERKPTSEKDSDSDDDKSKNKKHINKHNLYAWVCVYVSVCMSVWLSVCLSVSLSVCVCVCVCVNVSVYAYIS